MPLIVVAEVCSWYSVLTTSNGQTVAQEIYNLVTTYNDIKEEEEKPLERSQQQGCLWIISHKLS